MQLGLHLTILLVTTSAEMTLTGVSVIMKDLIRRYPRDLNDPNLIFKDNVILNLRRLMEAIEEYERYNWKLRMLQNECDALNAEHNQLQANANDLDHEIVNQGIDVQMQNLRHLQSKLDILKQLESLEKNRYSNVSSQMKNNYEMLQSRYKALMNDLNGMERDFNSETAHLRTLKETIGTINTELHKYDLRVSLKRESAENAMVVASLRNRNAILRLVREGRKRRSQESKDLLVKLEDELRMQEQHFKQSDSEDAQRKKARYDAYLEKLEEYEGAVAVYNEIENVRKELCAVEDLAKAKSAELESLSKLSETLSKDLERYQIMTSAAEDHRSFPGSIPFLQWHASEKCKELVEMAQNVYYRRAKYSRILEDRRFLRNLVSGVLTFSSAAVAARLITSVVASI